MDQLKTVMAFVSRQHFWLTAGFVVIVAVATWYLSTSALAEQRESNKSTFSTKQSAVQQVSAKNPHPNDEIVNQSRNQAEQMAGFVKETWNKLYQAQQQAALVWPVTLGEDFREAIAGVRFGEDLPKSWMVGRYSNYIKNHVRELPKIVEAAASEDGTSTSGPPGAVGPPGGRGEGGRGSTPTVSEELDYHVIWQDYGDLLAQLELPARPTSVQVWIAQEDLWVFETMLNVIARVNGQCNDGDGPTGPHDAAIKVIHALDVGQIAAQQRNSSGRIEMTGGGGAAPGGLGGRGPEGGGRGGLGSRGGLGGRGEGGGRGGFGGPPGLGGRGGEGGLGGVADVATLTAGRYLDETGTVIQEAGLGTDRVFKRLPVRMVLTMDQERLNQLLVECANAALPIEVEQVRINAETDVSGGAGGRGGGPPGLGGVGGPPGGGGRGEGGGGAPTSTGEAIPLSADTNIAQIEIIGTVFIYNQPDPQKLSVPWGQEGGVPGDQFSLAP